MLTKRKCETTNHTLFKGFTLAELMIAMLVFSIVAAAVVPVTINKKVKRNELQIPHGIYECFWDNGKLYEYKADNSNLTAMKGTLQELSDSTSCTFIPPKASYYKLQLIGAGGNGYSDSIKYKINDTEESEDSGSIELNALQTANLPDWVKRHWGEQKISLYMKAPIGTGGKAKCFLGIKPDDGCDDCNIANIGCPDDCKVPYNYNGGNSGKPAAIDKVLKVYVDDKIQYETNTNFVKFEHNNTVIQLNTASAGKNATTSAAGEDGTNSSYTANDENIYYAPTCNKGGICNNGIESAAEPFKDGVITLSPSVIEYSKNDKLLETELGENGKKGSVANYTFPNLGGKTLKLIPAQTSDNPTQIKISGFTLKANSGKNGETIRSNKQVIKDIEEWDSYTTALEYKPDNKNEIKSQDLGSLNNTGLESYITTQNLIPGTPGAGSYPYFNSITYSENITVGTNVTNNKVTTSLDTNDDCFDGSEPVLNDDGQYYCSGEKGSAGAVRIVW